MSLATNRFRLTYEVKLTFLHYLRYLLRECTYLPDPAARRYFHSHILERFRQFRPRDSTGTEFRQPLKRRIIQDAQRQSHLLRTCRKALSTLYRANAGHLRCLTEILRQTYGRSGKRRHELLQPYLQQDIPGDSEGLRKLAATADDPASHGIPKISKAVEVIVKAQKQIPDVKLSRTPINRIQPDIPASNKWGRPMPLKRVRNMKKRAYRDLLDRTLPPVPLEEWERLRDLSTGKISFEGPVRRRGDVGPISNIVVGRRHMIDARFMRKLWVNIFNQCPTMSWDPVNGKWSLKWGSSGEANPPLTEARVGQDDFLFEVT